MPQIYAPTLNKRKPKLAEAIVDSQFMQKRNLQPNQALILKKKSWPYDQDCMFW